MCCHLECPADGAEVYISDWPERSVFRFEGTLPYTISARRHTLLEIGRQPGARPDAPREDPWLMTTDRRNIITHCCKQWMKIAYCKEPTIIEITKNAAKFRGGYVLVSLIQPLGDRASEREQEQEQERESERD